MRKSIGESLDEGTYHEIKYRWVVLVVYILGALVNSLPAQTFSSINSIVEEKFNYSATIVTLNTLVFPIAHPIIAFPANWILDRFGMAVGCFGGGIILVAGVWTRTLIEYDQPFWCLFGSILASIGNIFILNSSSILATNWFKPASIPSIISLSVLANLISVALGASLPGLIIKKNTSIEKIQGFLRTEAIIITVPIIIMMLFLRNRPSISPSQSASNQLKEKIPYIQLLKKLFKNRQYLKIMLAMMFSYGTLTSYLANLDQCISTINPSLESGKMTSQIVLSAMITGIVSTFFFANRLRITLQYRNITMICLLASFINFSVLQLALSLQYSHIVAMVILGISVGFFIVPSTSLLISYSSEIVFPLGQGSASGYLFAASQTLGSVIALVSVIFIDKGDPWKVYLTLGIHCLMYLLALLAIFATKQTLNRVKYQLRTQHLLPEEDKEIQYSDNAPK